MMTTFQLITELTCANWLDIKWVRKGEEHLEQLDNVPHGELTNCAAFLGLGTKLLFFLYWMIKSKIVGGASSAGTQLIAPRLPITGDYANISTIPKKGKPFSTCNTHTIPICRRNNVGGFGNV